MWILLRTWHLVLGCSFLFTSLTLLGQDKFRVEKIGGLPADKCVFVLPPHSQVGKHGFWPWSGRTYKPRKRFRYQRVILDGLGSDYANSVNKLQDAKYEYKKNPMRVFRRLHGYLIHWNRKPIENLGTIYYTNNGCQLVLELDYDNLISQAGKDAFHDASILLLNSLLHLRAQKPFAWPPVLTQDIVEKCMELLPLPVEQVLARYGYRENDRHTTILLGPKVFLSVDGASREGETDFIYSPTIQYMVGFERDRNTGDRGGRIQPKPYLTLNPSIFTDNYIIADSGWVNLASSADIQLSTPLNGNDFWSLYQPIFKRNIHSAQPVPTLGDSPAKANSYIIASDSISHLYNNPGFTGPPPLASAAWFGQRSFLTPLFPFNVDGQFIFRAVKYRLQDLQSGALVPKDAKLYRMYKGAYKKVKGNEQQLPGLILLPGDKISF